eukprot:NODE_1852_length_735_cov_88.227405_g1443_i0.p1 GENE.NODE_1852_length_735_cov_88.227405_g1443_i0~~NODE_1852_length_735_cov_88.227405_g1443_i0.p1  ORF type:complete len:165 (-),score=31.13 NODE_1852_length_735_cov_88.227405_g1443_i0:65-559(-)
MAQVPPTARTVLMGDMNFRCELSTHTEDKASGGAEWKAAMKLITAQQHEALFTQYDRLQSLLLNSDAPVPSPSSPLRGYRDAMGDYYRATNVLPLPTFKFKMNTSDREYSPKRCPGWPDRVLFKNFGSCAGALLQFRTAPQITFSDHTPIVCTLSVDTTSATFL